MAEGAPAARLVLGTAQLGLDYGLSRPERMPDEDEVREILAEARAAGIRTFDTAEGYGTSESRLGTLLGNPAGCEIVTKLSLAPGKGSATASVEDLERRLQASLSRLGMAGVSGLLIHNASDFTGPSGAAIVRWLADVKRRGLAARVGISAYEASDLEGIEALFVPDIVQVPANLLDQRLLASPVVARLRGRGAEIHVRSVFLQGLLISDLGLDLPYFAPWRGRLRELFAAIAARGLTRLEASIAFARSLPWADRIVLGVHSVAQLRECLAANAKPVVFDAAAFATGDTGLIDPRRWPGTAAAPRPGFTAIVQARMSSTRLPGKVLLPILGRPMLELQVERIRRARHVEQVVIATSRDASDDPIAALAERLRVPCFRGSLGDVLDRYYHAAVDCHASHIVRITGDCPLIDPELITAVIERLDDEKAEYASNTLARTFPDGLDVEAFTFRALQTAWREAVAPNEREHVTPFLYGHGARFRATGITGAPDRGSWRWTVDHPEDFEFVKRVFERLYPAKPDFGTGDIVALLERDPAILEINRRHGAAPAAGGRG